jgi:hypothetical protein
MLAIRFFFGLLVLVFFAACAPLSTSVTRTAAPAATLAPTTAPMPSITASPNSLQFSLTPSTVLMAIYPNIYQSIQLPTTISSKVVKGDLKLVTLPKNTQPIIADLNAAAVQYKNFNSYNLERVATFTSQAQIYAVPIKAMEKYDFKSGVRAGLIYDKTGKLAGSGVYEVWLYDEKATLVDFNGKVIYTWKLGEGLYYQPQEKQPNEPLVFFIEGSCWFCWSVGGRCGCLVCL